MDLEAMINLSWSTTPFMGKTNTLRDHVLHFYTFVMVDLWELYELGATCLQDP